MPFYEYLCTECGKQTTILQKISDAPATECPSCHAAALTKQISASGFRLKGAGWYETDFKSDNKKNLAGDAGDTSAAAATAAADAKGDKPADKGDAAKKADSGAGSGAAAAAGGATAPSTTAAPAAKPSAPAKPTTPADS